MKNSVCFGFSGPLWLFWESLRENIALLSSNKNICWEHYSLRAMLVLGKICHWPWWAVGSASLREGEGNHLAASSVLKFHSKIKSLHNKNSVHYMNIFKHARVHINSVKVMWRYLGNSNTSREIGFKQKPHTAGGI